MKIYIATLISLLAVLQCCNQKKDTNSQSSPEEQFPAERYYVTDTYFQRSSGYDWVGVCVTQTNDTAIHVSIRSRTDIKRPTCSFDDTAVKTSQNIYQSAFENAFIQFVFTDSVLQITSEDEGALYYFCSGGGSLKNTYIRLKDSIDKEQLNFVDFEKKLSLQGITFDVKAVNAGFENKLIIQPHNLEIDNRPVEHDLDGWVRNAEIEDLNSDGFPEVVVYVQSSTGFVHAYPVAYSVNNGKSISGIYFPDPATNPEISEGYRGHDEFTLIETRLAHQFPVFIKAGNGWENSGRTRQITYTLEDGEASRYFKVDQVSEF